jgi:type I restriction enzyme S subunit
MKPYPKYKDSGVEWIGEVPEGWEVKKIKHSTYVKGRIGWHGLNSNDFINDGPFLVTGTDFSNGKIKWGTCYHVSMENYKKDSYIQLVENDLLIVECHDIVDT